MVRDGRLAELETLYTSKGDRFLRICLAILADEELARDAVQEGFANAVRARKDFRGDGPLEGWVWRMVVNAALKLRARRLELFEPEPNDRRPAQVEAAPDERVRAAVATLPERQRLALFLRYYADLGYEAIAAALGVRTGTVSATLHAARETLKRALEEVPHGPA
jgi:RNA polymerase sigma-70 factor (ECF subfamily)